MPINIGKATIGLGRPPYFVADIAANHDGSLDRAYKLIDLAKEAGAHAAKFQNFIASKIVSQVGFESLGGSYRINPHGKNRSTKRTKMRVFLGAGQQS